MKSRIALCCSAVVIAASAVSCAPPSGSTLLEVSTDETVCGGVFDPANPGCTTNAVSRQIVVDQAGDRVASATTGPDGKVVVAVPAGALVVSVPDAQPYQNCDAPSVVAVSGHTTSVVQTCTIHLP